jgi:hypothetical protein
MQRWQPRLDRKDECWSRWTWTSPTSGHTRPPNTPESSFFGPKSRTNNQSSSLYTGSRWSWLTVHPRVNFGLSKPIVFDFELNRAHVDLVTRNWKFRIASAHRNRIFLEKRQFAAGDQWTTRFSCNQQRFYRKNQKRFPATGCASRSGSAVPSSARAGFVTSRRCARSSPYFFAM